MLILFPILDNFGGNNKTNCRRSRDAVSVNKSGTLAQHSSQLSKNDEGQGGVMHFYFVFFTAHQGLGIFNINYTVLYSAICRPSDRTVGRPPGPGFGIQTYSICTI